MTRAEKRKMVQLFLSQYAELEDPQTSLEEWVALRLNLSLTEAGKLVREARGE